MDRQRKSSWLVNTAIAIGMTALGAACGPTYPNCDNDEQCHEGEFCVNGRCEDCRDDSQCPTGQMCEQNDCVPIPGWCNSDADCCLGRTCEKNFQGFPPLACTHKNGEACAPPPEGIDPKAWTGFCPAGSGCSQQHKCAMCGVDEFPCSTSDDCCFAYTCAAGRCR